MTCAVGSTASLFSPAGTLRDAGSLPEWCRSCDENEDISSTNREKSRFRSQNRKCTRHIRVLWQVGVQVLICWLFTWAEITRSSRSVAVTSVVDHSAGRLDLQALAGHRTAHGELRKMNAFSLSLLNNFKLFFLPSCDLNVKDRLSLITSI